MTARQTLKRMFLCLTLGLCLISMACANFVSEQRTRDRQSNIERAMQDDRECRDRGHEFPATGYTLCRQALQDRREQRQLFALEIIDPQGQPVDVNDPRSRMSSERGEFRCQERQWEETRWISCRTYPRD